MLNKTTPEIEVINWTLEETKVFKQIKMVLASALALGIPDIIYSFHLFMLKDNFRGPNSNGKNPRKGLLLTCLSLWSQHQKDGHLICGHLLLQLFC